MLHLGLLSSSYVDLNLKEQAIGLKDAISQYMDKIKSKKNLSEVAQLAKEEFSENLEQIRQSLKNGKKLRFSPKHEQWQKLDAQQAQAEAAQKAANKKAQEQNQFGGGGGNFLPPPEPIQVTLQSLPPTPEVTQASGGMIRMIEAACDESKHKTYGGIGVQYEPSPTIPQGKALTPQEMVNLRTKINKVPAGYPAYKAGIQVGDEIEGNLMRFRGEPGTTVEVPVYRQGRLMTFTMKRVKICYEEQTAANPAPKN